MIDDFITAFLLATYIFFIFVLGALGIGIGRIIFVWFGVI